MILVYAIINSEGSGDVADINSGIDWYVVWQGGEWGGREFGGKSRESDDGQTFSSEMWKEKMPHSALGPSV